MKNQYLTKPEAIEEHKIQQDESKFYRYSEEDRYIGVGETGYYDHSKTTDKYLRVELTAFDPDNDRIYWFDNYQNAITCADYSSDAQHGGWLMVAIYSTNKKPLAALSKNYEWM